MIDSGDNVNVIFMDFVKAFDKVFHVRLGYKLESYGITGKLLEWILNCLSARKQRVYINGVISEWKLVLSGVPQGPVLGPILFLIYINDLHINIQNFLLKFADDTKLFESVTTSCDQLTLQNDLNKLLSWSVDLQMLINVAKCKVKHFGRRNALFNYQRKANVWIKCQRKKT